MMRLFNGYMFLCQAPASGLSLAHHLCAFDRSEREASKPRRRGGGEAISGSCSGASNEGARSHHEGDGKADQLVSSGRNTGGQHTNNATNETQLEQGRLRWFIRPSSPPSQSETSSSEGTREGAGVVPGTLFGFQRPSFSREVTRATRRPLQLHVGQEGAADIGFSCRSPETGAPDVGRGDRFLGCCFTLMAANTDGSKMNDKW